MKYVFLPEALIGLCVSVIDFLLMDNVKTKESKNMF